MFAYCWLVCFVICPIVDEDKSGLRVVERGGLSCRIAPFVFVGFVVCYVVRPSLSLRACLYRVPCLLVLSSPPCCARPPLRCAGMVYNVTFLGGLVEVLLWLVVLVVALRMR